MRININININVNMNIIPFLEKNFYYYIIMEFCYLVGLTD